MAEVGGSAPSKLGRLVVRFLVFGHNDWWTWNEQGFCGRNAALVKALARRSEVERIAVVDTPRYRNRTHRPREHRAEAVTSVADGVVAVRYAFRLPLPAAWHPGRRANELLGWRRLRSAVEQALPSGAPRIVWVADPQAARLATSFECDLLVFDAIDDWRLLPGVDLRAVEQGYAILAERAGLVLAVNGTLIRRLAPRGRAEVLPNAVDMALWRNVSPDPAAFPDVTPGTPVAVYVGTLQERVDVDLLAQVAAAQPGFAFRLIGPRADGFRLPSGSPPNLRIEPAVAHEHVPGLLAAASVCLVPHHRGGIVDTMDPLKVYEYLAAGRPVVATSPPPYEPLRPFVRVAEGSGAFASALEDEIVHDSAARREARYAAVAGETWDARAARIVELLGLSRGSEGGVA